LLAIATGVAVAQQPVLALLGIGLLFAVASLLAWPEIATLGVVFLMFANVPSVLTTEYGIPQSAAVVIPLLLTIPIAASLLRGEPLVIVPTFLLLIVFLIVLLASTAQSAYLEIGLEKLRSFAVEGIFMFFCLTNAIRTTQQLRRVTCALLASAALLGALALFQTFTKTYYSTFFGFSRSASDFYYGYVTQPRLQGPIGDPNYFAQVMLIAIPLGMAVASTAPSNGRRWIAMAATGLTMGGIVMTYSRGAIVALTLMVVVMVALRQVRARQIALLVLALVAIIAAVPSYRERILSLVSIGGTAAGGGAHATEDQSVRARSTELFAALLAYVDHPVLGVGPGAFPKNYQRYANQVGGEVHDTVKFGPLKGSTPERQAHNMFVSIAAELGTLGLAALLWLLFLTARSLLRVRRRLLDSDPATAAIANGYFLAITVFLAAGVFLTLAFERYFWMLLALAAAAARFGQPGDDAASPPTMR